MQRVWVMPSVFAVVALSLPAQLLFAERFSEPYPGLFQPAFLGDSQDDDRVMELAIPEIRIDGSRIEPFDLFPTDGSNAREVVLSMFPRNGDMRVPDRTRRAMRSTLADRFDTNPGLLTVTWKRLVVDLESGTSTVGPTITAHRLDLRETAR